MKVLTMCLSLRKNSTNAKLLNCATTALSGATHESVDLTEYEMPYYNQDIEEATGVPVNGLKLKEKIEQASAIIIASPEYNFSMPGHFKNTFDWLSRCKPMPWKGKPVLLLSASPSLVAGNRGLWSLRVPLEAVGTFVHPDMYSLPQSFDAFNVDGSLKNSEAADRLNVLVGSFMKYAKALNA